VGEAHLAAEADAKALLFNALVDGDCFDLSHGWLYKGKREASVLVSSLLGVPPPHHHCFRRDVKLDLLLGRSPLSSTLAAASTNVSSAGMVLIVGVVGG
jgi:hypothetical protein